MKELRREERIVTGQKNQECTVQERTDEGKRRMEKETGPERGIEEAWIK